MSKILSCQSAGNTAAKIEAMYHCLNCVHTPGQIYIAQSSTTRAMTSHGRKIGMLEIAECYRMY